jgi:hypothetical protein
MYHYYLEYLTTAGDWIRVASYPTLEAATSAYANSAVIHKRIMGDVIEEDSLSYEM